jgi:hypothetical protein
LLLLLLLLLLDQIMTESTRLPNVLMVGTGVCSNGQ